MTLKQSSAVHIQALYLADGILLGSSYKLRLLVINLVSVFLEYLSKYWGFIKLQSEYQLRESFALVVFQLGEYT
jgi:hypothetical protein